MKENNPIEKKEESRVDEFYDLLFKKRKEKTSLNLRDEVRDIVEDLPGDLQRTIIEDMERLESYRFKDKDSEEMISELSGLRLSESQLEEIADNFSRPGLSLEQLKKEVEISSRRIRDAYQSKLCKMPNKHYAKYEMLQMIDDLMEDARSADDLKKIARISFDLNGLKAVNDLNRSHEKGDMYLKMMAGVLNSIEFKDFIFNCGICKDKNKLKVGVAHDSGDEFSVIIKSDKEIDNELLDEIILYVQSGLLDMKEESAKVLDFESETVLAAFGGFSEKEWELLSAKKRAEKIKEIKASVPDGYRFEAMASGGAATLYQALADSSGKKVKENDSYEAFLASVMGSIFDKSDAVMDGNKKEFKKGLKKGDEHDRFLLEVYSRTESELKLRQENENLIEERNELVKKNIEQIELIELLRRENNELRNMARNK